MRNIAKYLCLFSLAFVLGACSGMNDKIDPYLSQGEIVYIAKSDSVHVFSGKNRFLVSFWNKDPRATQMEFLWNRKKNSKVVDLAPDRDITVPVDVIIDELVEGDYTFSMLTHDEFGNSSIPDVHVVKVYGDVFQQMITQRGVKSHSVSGNKVTINWGNSYSSKEWGILLSYTDVSGNATSKKIEKAVLGSKTTLENVDVTKELSYQTLYLPEATAIDTFYVAKTVLLP